ncbi:hypothetical protein RUMHYD_03622, partial [Blautia hydrogenotrophica DSM 10507]
LMKFLFSIDFNKIQAYNKFASSNRRERTCTDRAFLFFCLEFNFA